VSETSSSTAAHTADAVVFRVGPDRQLEVLLWQRRKEPFTDYWALPGGFLRHGESLEESVRRHLREKVGVTSVAHSEQLETRSQPFRDPRGWVITTAFVCLVGPDLTPEAPSDTAWRQADNPPPLAFDHRELVDLALMRLRGKLSYSNIAFALTPEYFSISELAVVYRAVLGYAVSPTNLQRVLERDGLIEPTGRQRASGASGGRPAVLFRFSDDELTISKPFAAFRPR
jgi:ADP-ribose pyrophosphatase YjhB (NUDIX family)